MTPRSRETTQVHTRLLHYALQVDDARAYWARVNGARTASARDAFDEYWFGARSLRRIGIVLTNMRARFDAFPSSLEVLQKWPSMEPDTRRVICHWHLQLADPLYRAFSGRYLVERRERAPAEVTRDLVAAWVGKEGSDRWNPATCIQFASKLLSAAFSAGVVGSNRDPRPITFPRVQDEALEYLMYLLREILFEGSLVENPYLASVGLKGATLASRLRNLPGMAFRQQGDLVDFDWRHPDLRAWADARFSPREDASTGWIR